MDLSTVRKATTEAEKEQHRKDGRCFNCSMQGHIAKNCPLKKRTQARTTRDDKETAKDESKTTPVSIKELKPSDLAVLLRGYTDEENAEFVKAMTDAGEEAGFLDA
jgi:hypothetical protein